MSSAAFMFLLRGTNVCFPGFAGDISPASLLKTAHLNDDSRDKTDAIFILLRRPCSECM